MLVSADSDLCPAIRATKRLRRHSADLKDTVDGFLATGADKVRRAQLPLSVDTAAGVTLHRPKHWT